MPFNKKQPCLPQAKLELEDFVKHITNSTSKWSNFINRNDGKGTALQKISDWCKQNKELDNNKIIGIVRRVALIALYSNHFKTLVLAFQNDH